MKIDTILHPPSGVLLGSLEPGQAYYIDGGEEAYWLRTDFVEVRGYIASANLTDGELVLRMPDALVHPVDLIVSSV